MSKASFILPAIVASFTPPIAAILYWFIVWLLTKQSAESVGSALFYIGTFSFAISVLSVLFLGIPVILILHRFQCLRWWSVIGSGFFLACISSGIFLFPRYPNGATSISGDTATVIDGMTTMAGWHAYLEGVLTMGAFGALAALAFWCTWRKTSNIPHPTDVQTDL